MSSSALFCIIILAMGALGALLFSVGTTGRPRFLLRLYVWNAYSWFTQDWTDDEREYYVRWNLTILGGTAVLIFGIIVALGFLRLFVGS